MIGVTPFFCIGAGLGFDGVIIGLFKAGSTIGGIIEEMKYSNYYYGYPSLSTMQEVLNLLKKWRLLEENKKISYNYLNVKQGMKLLYFYLTKDKKSDRLVTLEYTGKQD